ncbi:hypothetical protein Ddye_004402 [Dipteronia dyeriana]|uniref:Uncharacterized protein n=1 Tax=Dipteronia dyeriana TaxID=168575 RepID=A0AAD9XVY4_9ROSI|nr:hypothetical protein Ddye_004402 [Dipteronia dyeriana]
MFQQLLEHRPNLNTPTANTPTPPNIDGVEGIALGCPVGRRPPRAARYEQFEDLSDEDSDEDFTVSWKGRTVTLTEMGQFRLRWFFGYEIGDLWTVFQKP